MPAQLTISTALFKSSPLAIPHSPFSPLSPLSPLRPRTTRTTSHTTSRASATYPARSPPSPLTWQWTCHACRSAYPLGATRRCLEDGHFFCAGEGSVERRGRKGERGRKRRRACGSAFDYTAWKGWGVWRRSLSSETGRFETEARDGYCGDGDVGVEKGREKDCWGRCDFPSQCRWGRSEGVWTPSMSLESESTKKGCATDEIVLGGSMQDHSTLDTSNLDTATLDPPAQATPSLGPQSPSLSLPFASSQHSCEHSNSSNSSNSSRSSSNIDVEMQDTPSPLHPSTALYSVRLVNGQDEQCIDPALLGLGCELTAMACGNARVR